ncbi:MAG: hypothetical protein ABIJ56_14655 [Pseudomonadota bacterium]
MPGKEIVPVLFICAAVCAAHAPAFAQQQDKAVYFWIPEKEKDDFPAHAAAAQDMTPLPASDSPVMCPGAGEEPADEAHAQSLKRAADLFYTNEFELSESILVETWDMLEEKWKSRHVRAELMMECFVFRMLIFKVYGKREEAESFARRAAEYIYPPSLAGMDIPPDGLEFIHDVLEAAVPDNYELNVSLREGGDDCGILVDGLPAPVKDGTLRFPGGSHTIQASCAGAEGWKWRIDFPAFDGKLLRLNPVTESGCDCSRLPLVVCGKLGEPVLKMGFNLNAYAVFSGFHLIRPASGPGTEGYEVSSLITAATSSLDDIDWHPPAAVEKPDQDAKKAAKQKKRSPVAAAALGLGIAAAPLAGLAVGLSFGSLKLDRDTHSLPDPWERSETAQTSSDLMTACAVTSALAASLVLSSLIYQLVVSGKKKGSDKKASRRYNFF